jgi:hypothetical protein
MSEMAHDVSAQRVEAERLDGAVRRLSDQSWSQGQTIARQDQRIKELEGEVLSLKAGAEDQRVNHCALDVAVIGVQERVKDLEKRCDWIQGLHDDHDASLEDFSVRLDNAEEVLEKQEEDWKKYDRDQKWNIIMAQSGSQRHHFLRRKVEQLAFSVSDVEETLMREIHCSHCLCGDGETIGNLPRDVSGWEPRYQSEIRISDDEIADCVRADEAIVAREMWDGDIDDMEPIEFRSPDSLISQEDLLRPITPLELDGPGSPESTQATSVPDENVVPLPVVRGVARSARRQRHSPYPTPPPASSSWSSAYRAPSGVIDYYVERPARFPGWGIVEEQVFPSHPILG